jgi:Tfp pilus assembly protein PilF
MNIKAYRLASVALASLLIGAAGCQFPDFRGVRDSAQNTPSGKDVARLSDRQVADVQLSMGHSYENQGDFNRAVDAYHEAIEKDPQRATAYWRLAVVRDRQGNVHESETLYRQALKREPKNADMHCDFGYSLYLQRRWAESEDHLRQAVGLKPALRRAHNNLGLLLAQTERGDEALAEFRKSGCQDAEAHTNLAFVLTLNRRWDEAREQYELALEKNPSAEGAKTGLENLNTLIAKSTLDTGAVVPANFERPADIRPAQTTQSSQTDRPGHATISTTGRND